MSYRQMRLPCDTAVTALLGENARRVRFVNISPTGARIEGLGLVPREASVTLTHLNTRIAARVVWANERQAGLRFVTPLSNTDMSALRGVGGSQPGMWASSGPTRFRELS
jgi:hypothetical protein